jgi:hypothetical protein
MPSTRKNLRALAPAGSRGLLFDVVIEQVGDTTKLFRSRLQSFNLLAQLRLLRLLLMQYLVDIPHSFSLLIEL